MLIPPALYDELALGIECTLDKDLVPSHTLDYGAGDFKKNCHGPPC